MKPTLLVRWVKRLIELRAVHEIARDNMNRLSELHELTRESRLAERRAWEAFAGTLNLHKPPSRLFLKRVHPIVERFCFIWIDENKTPAIRCAKAEASSRLARRVMWAAVNRLPQPGASI